MAKAPHLTPANLVGKRFRADHFRPARIALMGYCPPPSALKKYSPRPMTDQCFIHVPSESVTTFSHRGVDFVSLVHVYGGPVSASTVEELAYFGFDYLLAYGLGTVECGVISDVTGGKGKSWDSTLSVMLSSHSTTGSEMNPLDLTGKIVEFYIETLGPALLRKS